MIDWRLWYAMSAEISYPPALPVLVELRAVHCADSMNSHSAALTDEWPAQCVNAWNARNREMQLLEAEVLESLAAA